MWRLVQLFCIAAMNGAGPVVWWSLAIQNLTAADAVTTENTANKKTTTVHLPFGDINVVVLTDIHSWVGSHGRQEPYWDATLGDCLSFYERLKEDCDSNNRDLFLVNNGDFVDGTGLSLEADPSYLIPILERMPYDAVNCGNHELYRNETVEYMRRPGGYLDWWGDRYITSNVQTKYNNQGEYDPQPLSSGGTPGHGRYRILHGKHSNVLVFGFLYNMKDAASIIQVQHVQQTVKQDWFRKALSEEDYDAILILAHMDLHDPLVEVIRTAIRQQVGTDMPITFLTGHTHYRGSKQLDNWTFDFEAGRYLDTVGFVSFPSKKEMVSDNYAPSNLFHHVFLDANRQTLFQDTLGLPSVDDGPTQHGKELSEFIDLTRHKLGLDVEIGCAPRTYYLNRHVDAPNSLWGLYRDQIIPKIFIRRLQHSQTNYWNDVKHHREQQELDNDSIMKKSVKVAMFLAQESWRYDLHNNRTIVVDDIVAVAPFNDTVVYLGTFNANTILQANITLNRHSEALHWTLPSFILIGDILKHVDEDHVYHMYSHDFDAARLSKELHRISGQPVQTMKKTPFKSTLIWLAFVREYWSCNGTDQNSDWLPLTSDPQEPPSRRKETNWKLLAMAISFTFILVGILMGLT